MNWDNTNLYDICIYNGRRCTAFVSVYEMMTVKYKKYNDRMALIVGVLNVIATLIGYFNVGSSNSNLSIVITAINTINSVIAILQKVWRIQEIYLQSMAAVADFRSVDSEIKYQLSLKKEVRRDAEIYTQNVQQKIDALITGSPPIDDDVKAQYLKGGNDDVIFNKAYELQIINHMQESERQLTNANLNTAQSGLNLQVVPSRLRANTTPVYVLDGPQSAGLQFLYPVPPKNNKPPAHTSDV